MHQGVMFGNIMIKRHLVLHSTRRTSRYQKRLVIFKIPTACICYKIKKKKKSNDLKMRLLPNLDCTSQMCLSPKQQLLPVSSQRQSR